MNLICPIDNKELPIPEEWTDTKLHTGMYVAYHVRKEHGLEALEDWRRRVYADRTES